MSATGRTTLAYASLGHALCHGSQLLLRVSLVAVALDMGVSLTEIGLAITLYTLSMGLASVPAGLLADRVGTGRVTCLYFWLIALSAGLCALDQGYVVFLACHALLGAAAGVYHPAGLGLLSVSHEGRARGRAFGLHGVVGSLGIATVPLLAREMAGGSLGWRGSFICLAGAALVGGMLGVFLLRSGRLPTGQVERVEEDSGRSLPRGAFLLLAAVGINGFLLEGFTTAFPFTMHETMDITWDPYVMIAGVLALSGVGQYVGGALSWGGAARRWYLLMLVVQLALLVGMVLFFEGVVVPLFFMGAFAFTIYMTQPVENQIVADLFAQSRRGMGYAAKFLAALLVGSAAPILVTQFLETEGGTSQAYTLLAVASIPGLCAAWMLWRNGLEESAQEA